MTSDRSSRLPGPVVVALILALASSAPAVGQLAPSSVVLRGVNIVDGGSADVRRDVSVVVDQGRIAAIEAGDFDAPMGATEIDLTG